VLGLEHPTLILAARLQFEFAGRECEIINLEWDWVDLVNLRIRWPDSKTGSMDKVMSEEAVQLLSTAHRYPDSPFVCPAIFDSNRPLSAPTYWHAWSRMLDRAGVSHQGTHAIRHRAATEIANSGVPIKDGMAMTGHKTVAMFLSYVHPDEQRVRKSVEKVSAERRKLVDGSKRRTADEKGIIRLESTHQLKSSIALGNYRPYRVRKSENRGAPPNSKSASSRSRGRQNKLKGVRHEHHFRREELFNLVWKAPITIIAARIGISDVGLAKACHRSQIPLPPRGYWARVSAGQPASPYDLSAACGRNLRGRLYSRQ
jgi:Phage integrase family